MEQLSKELTSEQISLLKKLDKEIQDLTLTVKVAASILETRKKGIDDTLTMLCLSLGFDKSRVKIDLEKGIIFQEVTPNE